MRINSPPVECPVPTEEGTLGAGIPFDAIKYVGSALTLVAFIVATIAYVYRVRLYEQRKMIEAAPEQDRKQVLEAVIQGFSTVPVENLSNEQRYNLALKLIDERRGRFHMTAWMSIVAAFLLAGVVIVVSRSQGATSQLTVRLHGPSGREEEIGRGTVTLEAGPIRLTKGIGPDGVVRFTGLPPKALAHGGVLRPKIAGFRASSGAGFQGEPPGDVIDVSLVPDSSRVFGTILDNPRRRSPLPGVVLDFNSGEALDTTDAHGNFAVVLSRPAGARVPLRLTREGVTRFDDAVTVSTSQGLILYFEPDSQP